MSDTSHSKAAARTQTAAQLAVGAPFCLFVFLTLAGLLRSQSTAFNSDAVNFVINLITALWLLFSLGASVYALIMERQLGLSGLRSRALIGLGLVLLFVLSFAFRWHKQRTHFDEAIASATATYVHRIQQEAKKYDDARERFDKSSAIRFTELSSREKINSSREVVRQFIMANNAVTTFIRNENKNYEEELRKYDLPEIIVQNTLARFKTSNEPRQKLLLKIRECDDRMSKANLEMLDMLDAHFGDWSAIPKSGLITFKDKALIKDFNALVVQLQTAAREQAEAQHQLLQLSPQKKPAML